MEAKDYTVDWQQLLAESASIHQRLLDAMNDRVPAGDPAVMDLAEEHRQHTDRWYHDCEHEIHRHTPRPTWPTSMT